MNRLDPRTERSVVSRTRVTNHEREHVRHARRPIDARMLTELSGTNEPLRVTQFADLTLNDLAAAMDAREYPEDEQNWRVLFATLVCLRTDELLGEVGGIYARTTDALAGVIHAASTFSASTREGACEQMLRTTLSGPLRERPQMRAWSSLIAAGWSARGPSSEPLSTLAVQLRTAAGRGEFETTIDARLCAGLLPPGHARHAAHAHGAAPHRPPVWWQEHFLGGDEETETRRFEEMARQIREVQARLRGRRSVADRGLHAKMLAGTARAVLKVEAPELTGGYLRAGERYPVTVRFSSASGLRRDDHARDARGIALRVHAPTGDHDLLLTNAEVSHVRDAEEFMGFVRATSHGMLPGLAWMFARRPRRTLEIVRTLLRQTADCERSLAHETFWSRAPFLLGATPVRYQLVPHAMGEPHALADGPDFLFFDLKRRLRVGPLRYDLRAQPYESEKTTPIEDASVRWATQPQKVAVLELEQQELPMPCTEPWRAIDAMAYNPWHAPDDMRPLGSLNRARKLVYRASQRERDLPADAMGCPLHTLPALIGTTLRRLARLR